MIVYLMRHGIAEEPEDWNGADRDRPLTEKGRRRVREVAEALKRLDCRVDAVSTSSYLRARQTAEIVVEILAPPHGLREEKDLTFEGSHAGMLRTLASVKAHAVMLVGHEPLMGELASLLVAHGSSRDLRFKKSGVACLDLPVGGCEDLRGSASLLWLLAPKELIARVR